MSIHDGHRKRLRQKYLAHGPAVFNDHELLELILTYSIPRRDVNPLAHELINKYGSLKAVLYQDAAELTANKGISENTASLLKLFADFSRGRMFSRSAYKGVKLKNLREAMLLCVKLIKDADGESACVLLLDQRSKILDCCYVPGGALSVEFSLRRIVACVNACGASMLVIAHPHPSGEAAPSEKDKELNEKLTHVLEPMGVTLAEHVIVTDKDCVALMHDVRLSEADMQKGADDMHKLLG